MVDCNSELCSNKFVVALRDEQSFYGTWVGSLSMNGN